jgi:signal transduction histidine kinase
MSSPLSSADIEQGRSRLLASAFVLLGAFAGLSVLFSFLGSDYFGPLQLTPLAARIGVLILTVSFIVLVAQKERQYRRWSRALSQQAVLAASFQNRLEVVEGLLEASDRLNAPLAVEDVLRVILHSAVKLVGAESGSIDFMEDQGEGLAIAQSHSIPAKSKLRKHKRETLKLPLKIGGETVGVLSLNMPRSSSGFDNVTVDALNQFVERASQALFKANIIQRERASTAYLEASNLVKSRFLTTVSHELRTPLTSVLGYAKTLDNHWDKLREDQKREFVREIGLQGDKLARLVERILEAARVELEGLVIRPVLHDVRASVETAIATFDKSDGERLEVALPPSSVHGDVDPFVVEQVVSNLVDNGLRYTEGQVRVSMDVYRSSLRICVTDAGPGIDPSYLGSLVEPLHRIDDNIQSGTGLGLHIVKTLVEGHGGRGEIRTGPTGTSVTVMLPRSSGNPIPRKIHGDAVPAE